MVGRLYPAEQGITGDNALGKQSFHESEKNIKA